MSDLAEAIEMMEGKPGWPVDQWDEAIYNAARGVLEADQVQWCETHEDPFWRTVFANKIQSCRVGWDAGEWDLCSIVPKLLVEGVGDE